ncbi:MAG: aspartate--tRNA ligase [Phycisphaerae bacterium]
MPLPYNRRTAYCNEITETYVGQRVTLCGWVHNRRDHGGMVFIDLRDRSGLVQLKFNPETDPKAHDIAGSLRSEYCICVAGDVSPRPEGLANPNLATGKIEVNCREIDILSDSPTPRFPIEDNIDANEELRLKYRWLDLRRRPMQNALITRHRITKIMRDYFDENGFIEIETPFLTKSTPEGARDFLVPSRIHPGTFFALPQSPQLFKQLLMMSGFDKYIQIARCFRDEDSRADRQPEFAQLDLEMSFVEAEDVQKMTEGCIARLMKEVLNIEVTLPFPRMSYADAMRNYGIDRPDTRYDLRLSEVSEVARTMDFKIFADALAKPDGCVRALRVPGGGAMTRKETDTLTEDLKGIGAGGLPLVKVVEEGGAVVFQTGIAKFFTPESTAAMCAATNAVAGDLLFFSADREANVCKYLAWLRETVAKRQNLIPENRWNYLWVQDFPMFEYNEEDGRHYAMHHPFTAPRDEDVAGLDSDPTKVRAKAYDLVLNGIELGGGSIRIHRQDVQKKVFDLLHMSKDEQEAKFGFLLEALKYGPPPHGGIALGLDRTAMLFTGMSSIRDVFSFPKTKTAFCPMTEAPSAVAPAQLEELHIRTISRTPEKKAE